MAPRNDIAELFETYAEQRKVRAGLEFAEKIARVERMRERAASLRAMRPENREAVSGD